MTPTKACGVLMLLLAAPSLVLAGTFVPTNGYVFDSAHQHPNDLVWVVDQDSVSMASGGDIGSYLRLFDSAVFNYYGGILGSYVYLGNSSQFKMHGGEISSYLWADNTSKATIDGGIFTAYIHAASSAQVDISGGTMWYLDAEDSSNINIYGTNLLKTSNTITGTLADGTAINVSYMEKGNGHINLHTVPEPSTFLMSCVGVVVALVAARRIRR